MRGVRGIIYAAAILLIALKGHLVDSWLTPVGAVLSGAATAGGLFLLVAPASILPKVLPLILLASALVLSTVQSDSDAWGLFTTSSLAGLLLSNFFLEKNPTS
ncbi:hypothetical protein OEZ60_17820 [Defluviimonas sp. WL0024]|uniref:Uncharacterized protein n=1 Tax=Albidovulum salinarum TaxID=2984153 RepID=A0ABT2X897_9RHOB|nr:hypothetical protein [Defluviimonas sp. WL0024]MCU9849860.1 hypothetical protein [Defluviimonas sp. WL0024]